MIQESETNEKLSILLGRVRNKILSSSIENVAEGSANMSDVSRVLEMTHSTVQKVLKHILYFYPYKIQLVNLLQDEN